MNRIPAPITPLSITAYSAASALGRGLDVHAEALRCGRGGLRANGFSCAPLACWIGRVGGVEEAALPASERRRAPAGEPGVHVSLPLSAGLCLDAEIAP